VAARRGHLPFVGEPAPKNRLDHEVNERCERKPVMVRYADDFMILCRRGDGPGLMARLKQWLDRRGLTLNKSKTRLVDIRREGSKFLGFSVSQRRRFNGQPYVHVEPHAKSRQKLRDTVRAHLNHWTQGQAEETVIQGLNRALKGGRGTSASATTRMCSRRRNTTTR